MTATIYQKGNANYSDVVHALAREQVYPKLFGVEAERLTYDVDTLVGQSEFGDVLDGEMGIDRIVRVSVAALNGSLPFTVQERFRRPKYSKFRDITVTEWNYASDLPSELYKIRAQIFLYGYADKDDTPSWLTEAIAVNTTGLLIGIANGSVAFEQGSNPKRQSFLSVPFGELEANGLVIWRNKRMRSPDDSATYMNERLRGYPADWRAKFISALGG